MKTKLWIIGLCILVSGFTSCRNKSAKVEDDLTMTGDHVKTHIDTSMHGGMTGAMDKMMKGMHGMKMTGNVDKDFAMMMRNHYQGSVTMLEEELSKGKNAAMKQMAQNMIEKHKTWINQLDSFIINNKDESKNYDPAKKDEGFGNILNKNMMMMMEMPKADEDHSTDLNFANMMISHYQGGLQMAEGYVQHGKDPDILSIAKKMVQEQKKDISELKKWTDNQQ